MHLTTVHSKGYQCTRENHLSGVHICYVQVAILYRFLVHVTPCTGRPVQFATYTNSEPVKVATCTGSIFYHLNNVF